MMAVFSSRDGQCQSISRPSQCLSIGPKEIHLWGSIQGSIDGDYRISPVNVNDLGALSDYRAIYNLVGEFSVVVLEQGAFHSAGTDISGVNELFYASSNEEIIIGDDIFEVARILGLVTYDIEETKYFLKHGYCRPGVTVYRNILRIPPGKILETGEDGALKVVSCMDQLLGRQVTYSTFENALNQTLDNIVARAGGRANSVLFSGGVDSSVLVGALAKRMLKTVAVTMEFRPGYVHNLRDLERASRIAKKIGVEREMIIVDFKDATVQMLDRISLEMPLAAHLSIPFDIALENVSRRDCVVWSGQNCDTLYNLGPTSRFEFVLRYLLSDSHIRMLQGVQGHERYAAPKQMVDFLLRAYCRRFYGQRYVRIPRSIEELVRAFVDSDTYLAVEFDPSIVEFDYDTREAEMTARDAAKLLFDAKIGSFFTGRDHRVIVHVSRIHNLEAAIPYSSANMVQLFRNLRRSLKDVVLPKRFLYRYAARNIGLARGNWSAGTNSSFEAPFTNQWEEIVLGTTTFGEGLSDAAKQSGFTDLMNWKLDLQSALSTYWLVSHHQVLRDNGVGVALPQ